MADEEKKQPVAEKVFPPVVEKSIADTPVAERAPEKSVENVPERAPERAPEPKNSQKEIDDNNKNAQGFAKLPEKGTPNAFEVKVKSPAERATGFAKLPDTGTPNTFGRRKEAPAMTVEKASEERRVAAKKITETKDAGGTNERGMAYLDARQAAVTAREEVKASPTKENKEKLKTAYEGFTESRKAAMQDPSTKDAVQTFEKAASQEERVVSAQRSKEQKAFATSEKARTERISTKEGAVAEVKSLGKQGQQLENNVARASNTLETTRESARQDKLSPKAKEYVQAEDTIRNEKSSDKEKQSAVAAKTKLEEDFKQAKPKDKDPGLQKLATDKANVEKASAAQAQTMPRLAQERQEALRAVESAPTAEAKKKQEVASAEKTKQASAATAEADARKEDPTRGKTLKLNNGLQYYSDKSSDTADKPQTRTVVRNGMQMQEPVQQAEKGSGKRTDVRGSDSQASATTTETDKSKETPKTRTVVRNGMQMQEEVKASPKDKTPEASPEQQEAMKSLTKGAREAIGDRAASKTSGGSSTDDMKQMLTEMKLKVDVLYSEIVR